MNLNIKMLEGMWDMVAVMQIIQMFVLNQRCVYRLHTNFQFVYRIYHDTVRITETDDIMEKTDGTL
nr:hypothetical protein [Tanacetum cinerariifolium]